MKVQRHDTQRVKRDWVVEAEKLSDVDALRLLWAEASQAGASQTVLTKVKTRAEQLGTDGKPEGSS